jgi:hypothetical protein
MLRLQRLLRPLFLSILVTHSSLLAIAAEVAAATSIASVSDLRSGDIILMPLRCGTICTMIQDENDSPYTHSGIVLKNNLGNIVIAESSTEVSSLDPKSFLSFRIHRHAAC